MNTAINLSHLGLITALVTFLSIWRAPKLCGPLSFGFRFSIIH
jgi:hypothetical protein